MHVIDSYYNSSNRDTYSFANLNSYCFSHRFADGRANDDANRNAECWTYAGTDNCTNVKPYPRAFCSANRQFEEDIFSSWSVRPGNWMTSLQSHSSG